MRVDRLLLSKIFYAVALVLFAISALGRGDLVEAGLAFTAAGLLAG